MYKVTLRNTRREKRKLKIRGSLSGTALRPRLSIFRSNKYVYGQIIDDVAGKTIASITLTDVKKAHDSTAKVVASEKLGEELAKKALAKKVTSVVFDRNGYKYHGRVKSFADGLRKGGLEL